MSHLLDKFTLTALRDTPQFQAIWTKLRPACPFCQQKMKQLDLWDVSSDGRWVFAGLGCSRVVQHEDSKGLSVNLGVVLRVSPQLIIDMARASDDLRGLYWNAPVLTLPITASLELSAMFADSKGAKVLSAVCLYPGEVVGVNDYGLPPTTLDRTLIRLVNRLETVAPFVKWWADGVDNGYVAQDKALIYSSGQPIVDGLKSHSTIVIPEVNPNSHYDRAVAKVNDWKQKQMEKDLLYYEDIK